MNRIKLTIVFSIITFTPIMAQQKIVQSAGRQQLGDFLPATSPPSSPTSTTTSFSARYGAAMTSFRCVTAAL